MTRPAGGRGAAARTLAAAWLALAAGCGSANVSARPAAGVGAAGEDEGVGRMIWPRRLEPGDTIMFVAPAGPLDGERMARARRRLEERGYRVVERPDLLAETGYLAGDDERRAAELMEAFLAPEVDAVFPGTGGYGTMRILDRLDYRAIRAHPKLLIGFSDLTALHAALNRHAGLVTFHSPNPMWGLGSEDGLSEFSARWFFRAIERRGHAGGAYVVDTATAVRPGPPPPPPQEEATATDPAVPGGPASLEAEPDAVLVAPPPPPPPPRPWGAGGGRARGRLVGGNLSMISALEGTPYSIDTRDAILLIEDLREAPYRVDRMLRQLELAGKLRALRGAVVGQFTRTYDREDEQRSEDPRFTMDGVLRHYFANAGVPVLMDYPVGHHPMNATLPLGGLVEIDADTASLRVLDGRPVAWRRPAGR